MPSSALRRVFSLVLVFSAGLLVVGSACDSRVIDDGTDAGSVNVNQPIACESADECPDATNYDCLGICLQRCAADGVCKLDEFCSTRGYCELGCRDSSTCDANEVCSNGSCLSTDGLGSCGTKCDCQPGEVCTGGVCQSPPEECNGPAECGRGQGDQCEDYLCNGFTKQCFDDDPDPCSVDGDCTGRPGCGDGCACSPNQQCVPSASCTAHDDCGAGFYCTADLECAVPPACTSQADCTSLDLVCNLGTSQCEAPSPCTASSDCTTPPSTFCDTGTGSCTFPTCDNGGTTCQAGQDCVNGSCVAAGTGTACNSDANCPNDPWPDTQFCNYQTISGEGECSIGCRSNASCTGGQQCNSQRQCVAGDGGGGGGGGLGQAGDPCDEPPFDPDCAAGLVCTFYGTCEETCETPGPCTDCCPMTGYQNCEQGVFLNFCSP